MGEVSATPEADASDYLTTAELAARFRAAPSTIRYWRHVGYGPKGTRFGRKVLYHVADVRNWEAQQVKQDPKSATA